MKRIAADTWFSKCVRLRTNYTCEGCGKVYDPSSMGLHCSHYFGRRAYSVRFDPDNAFAHCYGCHQRFGSNPDDFHHWALGCLGDGRIQILRERREDSNLAKDYRKNIKDVSSHFRDEFRRMEGLRAEGETGRIEIEPYL